MSSAPMEPCCLTLTSVTIPPGSSPLTRAPAVSSSRRAIRDQPHFQRKNNAVDARYQIVESLSRGDDRHMVGYVFTCCHWGRGRRPVLGSFPLKSTCGLYVSLTQV